MPETMSKMMIPSKRWIYWSFTAKRHISGDRIEYLRELRDSDMKIEALKDKLLEYEDYSAITTARWIIESCMEAAATSGATAHENISRKAFLHASKFVYHNWIITEPWARRWIDSWRSKIRDVESYDEMMELYTDNKVFKPMIYSYVTNVVNRSRKK